MSEDLYPLFPELPEAGKAEAQLLIDKFKLALKKAAEEALANLYMDIVPHIESDSWTNYRTDLMNGFRNYQNRLVQGEHDFTEIRKAIFEQFHEEIVQDLNQDLLKRVADLEREVEMLRTWAKR